ncbi:MAG: hypothetical protein JOZ62_22155, partial [Acidobacteriaceae bacterium]|nr:hypothetical protein [Acidobacteriaceae bacterium]
MKNSGGLRRSKRARTLELFIVSGWLAIVIALAAASFYRRGYILYYGDAQAHLDLSRSIIDSRTPGYDQLGTVWLPLLHVICLPFVRNVWLWSTGLAGTIPVAFCFVVAGTCFYFAAKTTYGSSLAAAVVICVLALNPNVLYLGSIPMTEVVFFAGLALFLVAFAKFRTTARKSWLTLGIAASWAMSLTRYDGWFLIPFASLWFAIAAPHRKWIVLAVFGVLASLAPAYWILHNWWETGNGFDFYSGPYSAKAIQGSKPYSGYHDWALSVLYYGKAAQLCAGSYTLAIGILGVVCAAIKRVFAPLGFLLLTPLFYIWSLHSSGNPIHVPQLWPYSYYNTRYGIALVIAAAFASGAIVSFLPVRFSKLALALPIMALIPWLARPGIGSSICWKESQVNSVARRAWTDAGA